MPVLRESLTMDVIQSINKSICWNKIFDGIGSRQQDLHGEERMISLTFLHDNKSKEYSFSPVKERAFGVKSFLRESKTDRILEILEMK